MDKVLKFNYGDVSFKFSINENERIISQEVQNTGAWEPYCLDVYKKLLPPEGGVFVDVGANVGINSLFVHCFSPDSTVVSIEPEPANFELLKRNTEGTSIRIVRQAISDVTGRVSFSGSGTNASLRKSADSISVKAITFDEFYFDSNLGYIDIVKIDVEGYTDIVLSKSESVISNTNYFIIEFSILDLAARYPVMASNKKDFITREFAKIFEIFYETHKYIYYISRKNGLVEICDASELFEIISIEYGVGDVVFSRNDIAESISSLALTIRWVHELMAENQRRIDSIDSLSRFNKKENFSNISTVD